MCVFLTSIEQCTQLSRWDGLKAYLESDRTPLYCGEDGTVTKGFVRSYKNFFFYWILGAGHFVSHLIPLTIIRSSSLSIVFRLFSSNLKRNSAMELIYIYIWSKQPEANMYAGSGRSAMCCFANGGKHHSITKYKFVLLARIWQIYEVLCCNHMCNYHYMSKNWMYDMENK